MLLSPQDVLDYSSFSEASSDPTSILSAEAFGTFYPVSNSIQQGSMDMFSFQEAVATTTPTSASATAVLLAHQSPVQNIDQETIRHATMLRAYLANQHQQDQSWMVQSLTPMQVMEQAQQQEQQRQQECQDLAAEQNKQPLTKTQLSDAENLARYLAQSQRSDDEIEGEEEEGAVMEHDTALVAPLSPPLSSSGSEMGDKSPSVSPTLSRRSLSPDETSSVGSVSAKNGGTTKSSSSSPSSTRQLVCFNCKATQTPLWRRTPDRQHSLCNACGLYFKQYGAHRPLNVRHKLSSVLADVRLNFPYVCVPSRGSSRGSSPAPGSPTRSQDSSSSSDSDSDSGSNSSSSNTDQHNGLVSIPELAKMYARALAPPPPPPPPMAAAQRTSPPLMTAKQGIQCVNCSQTQTPLWRKNDAGEPICNACGLYAKLHNRDRPVTMRKSKIIRRRRDWGGNLAHRAQMEAQALANAHAQAQALALAHVQSTQGQATVPIKTDVSSPVTVVDAEVQQPTRQPQPQQQQQQQQQPALSQSLSNNSIMDENKFVDMVGNMNAHQMNRFLSILESRCGVLRERLLASTEEATALKQAQPSDLGKLF